jgi:hypothetical protein
LTTLTEIQTGTERVLNTPLPEAYSIVISQITWIYVLALPFQLYKSLSWVTIPGSLLAAYIILGIAAIGKEIENPFGHDVNDLPLDSFCNELSEELDILMSKPAPTLESFVQRKENLLFWPLSGSGWESWNGRSVGEIRDALGARVKVGRRAGSAPAGTGPGMGGGMEDGVMGCNGGVEEERGR